MLRRGPIVLFLAAAVAGVALGAMALMSLKTASRPEQSPPGPPLDVGVSFSFQGGPSLVFVCWSAPSGSVDFYDVGLERWSGGQPRQEVRYGVSTSSCGGGLGTGEYMFEPDLYHYAVRACNSAGCSPWADASQGDRYWFALPCSDPSGDACAKSVDLSAGH